MDLRPHPRLHRHQRQLPELTLSWPSHIETERLILRPLAEADLPALVRELGRWEVARWLIRVPHPYTEVDARRWLETCRREDAAGRQLFHAVTPKGGGGIVGGVGLRLHAHGPGEAELGYWFAPAVWGRGYGTETARAALRAAFADLNMVAVQAAADPENHGSNRVLEKAGLWLWRVDPAFDRVLRGPPGPANIWRIEREEWRRQNVAER